MREADPVAVLKYFVEQHGSQQKAADVLGCSKQFVGQLVNRQKNIPESIYRKLGLRRTVVAVEK